MDGMEDFNVELTHIINRSITESITLLPSQGLISVFVHHNTLHNFEGMKFEQATTHAKKIYGYECYMSESYYRKKMSEGQISNEIVEQIIDKRFNVKSEPNMGIFGQPSDIRKAMLLHDVSPPLHIELPWLLTESNLLTKFQDSVTASQVTNIIKDAQKNLVQNGCSDRLQAFRRTLGPIEKWSKQNWESVIVSLLWDICYEKITSEFNHIPKKKENEENFDKKSSTIEIQKVNEILIKFCSSFVDQGFALIQLPYRDKGFLYSFLKLYESKGFDIPYWLNNLDVECSKWLNKESNPHEIISYYLNLLNISQIYFWGAF